MKEISEVLARLNSLDKVIGSLVITTEGMIVASGMTDERRGEELAAFSSVVGSTITGSLKKMEMEPFTRYVLTSEGYKVFILNIDKFYLVAQAKAEVDPEQLNVKLYEVTALLKKMGRLV